jgi:hypothetical protein
MRRVLVKSNSIVAVVYHDSAGLLGVQFVDGTAYVFSGVPESVVDGLVNADSAGRYFNEHIKPSFAATPVPRLV